MAERNFVVSKSIVADNVGEIVETTVTANTATTVASFPLSDSDTVEFTVKATQGDRRYSSKALALHNGTTVDLAQYGELSIGESVAEVVVGTGAVTWVTRSASYRTDAATESQLQGVVYNSTDTWVAVGIGGIRSSTDAITWTTRTHNPYGGNGSYFVTYANNLFVSAGDTGSSSNIKRSTDGITWTSTSQILGATLYSIAYGNSLWAAGGSAGRLATSTDAITWTTRTSNFGNTSIYSIAYGNSLWAAGGSAGQLRTSTDAITWTTRTSNFGDTNIGSIAYGNNLWVAGGNAGQIRTSTDAITWTTRESNFGNTVITSVAFGNSLWVAVGGTYSGVSEIRTSTDAINWVTRTSNISNARLNEVAYGNGLWVAVGQKGSLVTSATDTSSSVVEMPLTLSADISGSDVRLRATITDAATTNAEVKVLKTTL